MYLKVSPFLFLFLSVSLINILAAPAVAQRNHFKILSFSKDGKSVTDYSVAFEINGQRLEPDRNGDTVYVPVAAQEAEAVNIVFTAKGFEFGFGPLQFQGYTEADQVRADYVVEIDTPPFKKSAFVGKHDASKYRAIYYLKRIPTVPAGSHLIADPISFITKEPRTVELGGTKTGVN